MRPHVEDDLERLFNESAATMTGLPAGWTDAVVSDAVARRRNRRRTLAGATCTLLVVTALAAWQAPGLVERSSGPADGPDSRRVVDDPAAWAVTLPAGEAPRAAYVVGQTLYSDTDQARISGPSIDETSTIALYGPGEGGWLAANTTIGSDDRVLSYSRQLGWLAPDGRFEAYTVQPRWPDQELWPAMAPNGGSFILGRRVYDTRTGALVTVVPGEGVAAFWVEEGVISYDPSTLMQPQPTLTIWDDSGSDDTSDLDLPVGAFDHGRWVVSRSGTIVVNADDCADLVTVDAPADVVASFCAGTVVALSPSATYALTADFRIIDTSTGEITALPVPRFSDSSGFDPVEDSWLYWENDDQLIWDLPRDTSTGSESVLIRCIVSEQRCERLGNWYESTGAARELVSID